MRESLSVDASELERGWLRKNDEINLVNDVVIAIRVSLGNYRRELVKKIFVDAFTFEVARVLDKDLSERIGDGFASKIEKERLVAVFLALKNWGLVVSEDHGRKTWFCFGSEAKRLDGFVPDEKLEELATKVGFMLKKSEMLRSIELSKRYCAELDVGVVVSRAGEK